MNMIFSRDLKGYNKKLDRLIDNKSIDCLDIIANFDKIKNFTVVVFSDEENKTVPLFEIGTFEEKFGISLKGACCVEIEYFKDETTEVKKPNKSKKNTTLTYSINRMDDFWKEKITRSYYMEVTADTRQECREIMNSFEDAIYEAGIQESFEGNDEPTKNKEGLWVGMVEIWISNEDTRNEKKKVADCFKAWKKANK